MGSQDDLALAQSFVENNGTQTPLMTWDQTFLTWEHYGVRAQPTTILVDPSGEELGRWVGLSREMFDLVEDF